jgi:hypothetical protein
VVYPRDPYWDHSSSLYTQMILGSLRCTTCILFANDTTIYVHVSGKNITELYKLVNQDIALLAEWFTLKNLSLNISKTHHVLFSKTKKSDTYVLKLDNTIINRVKCVNFLGLLMDENLNWHEHIDSCRSKISGGLYILNTIKHILSTHNMRILYHSLIYPYLTYDTLLWGSTVVFNQHIYGD